MRWRRSSGAAGRCALALVGLALCSAASGDAQERLAQGNRLVAADAYADAARAFAESIDLAERDSDYATAARARLNAGRLAWTMRDADRAREQITAGLAHVDRLTDGPDKVLLLLSAARAMLLEPGTPRERPWDRKLAFEALSRARAIATQTDDRRGLSFAYGYLGDLYRQAGRHDEARQSLGEAVQLAQALRASDLLYRWHWSLGRSLQASGQTQDAVAEYRQAVNHLTDVRPALEAAQGGSSTFRTVLGPMYIEFADILLQLSALAEGEVERPTLLREVMSTVERLKTAELQDYFLDECVVEAQSRATGVAAIDADTAVLYPVLLDDRLEVILNTGGDMHQVSVSVDRSRLTRVTSRWRATLERAGSNAYLEDAQQIYDWLIRPLHTMLDRSGVRTLVIVPDGPLRTIPLAALHDGEQFLIERFELATTPGLSLTDARPLTASTRILASGLSVSVDSAFSPLPAVADELTSLAGLVDEQSARVLLNEDFTSQNVESELEANPYSVVHIASHGQFRGNASDSFVLAYDGKITMDRLERLMQYGRFSDQPVELLTLSACETAVGDERAALGLSGIAIKAGARSAIGSLWRVNDRATATLIAEFYSELTRPGTRRAAALRAAQLSLLKQPAYSHPALWSSFLLIGSWL